MDPFLESEAADQSEFSHQTFVFETNKHVSGIVSDSGLSARCATSSQETSLQVLPHLKLGVLYQLKLKIVHLGEFASDITIRLHTTTLRRKGLKGVINLITYHVRSCNLKANLSAQVSSIARFECHDGMVITCIFDTVKRLFVVLQEDQEVGQVDVNSQELWKSIDFEGGVGFSIDMSSEGQEVKLL
eukprot:747862-Hanusia_phi.AAC.2